MAVGPRWRSQRPYLLASWIGADLQHVSWVLVQAIDPRHHPSELAFRCAQDNWTRYSTRDERQRIHF